MILDILFFVAFILWVIILLAMCAYIFVAYTIGHIRPSLIWCEGVGGCFSPCFCEDCAVCRKRDRARCEACASDKPTVLIDPGAPLCIPHHRQDQRILRLERELLPEWKRP
jgi:hypothetical protein